MNKLNFGYYKSEYLIILVIVIAFITFSFNKFIANYFYSSLSITAAATSIIFSIDQYLWKYIPFKWLVWVPDISGRYEGEIIYRDIKEGRQEVKKCALEVFQTASKIKISCYFQKYNLEEKTISRSQVERLIKNDDESIGLVFTYQNNGKLGIFPPHFGTNVLRYIDNEEGKALKGIYYTNREPQTKGEMRLRYHSNKLKNDF